MGRLLVVLALASCQQSPPAPTAGSGTRAPRIVTLSPSATEIVAALGATGDLVGVDDYSDYPDAVKQLPKVGSFMTPNLEAIVQLRPTLVIVDDIHSQVTGALHDAGIATQDCPMHAVPDVKACLLAIGGKLALGDAATTAVSAIDKALDAAAAHRPAHHPKVLLVIDREQGGINSLVAAASGTFNDELLAVVGGDNVLAGATVKYPKIGVEEVLRAQPDIILDLSYAGRDSMKAWDQLDVPAVKAKRVELLISPLLSHPTPRIAEALELMARAID
ncbi:MAG: helical backbone metal receptor [Kofleriaceae bacterium]